jgi:hypothetical protein
MKKAKKDLFYPEIEQITIRLQKIVKKYKKYEVAKKTIPGEPNTSTFRATVSGFVRLDFNIDVSYGYQDFLKATLPIGLKVGSGIKLEIREKIKTEVQKVFKKYLGSFGEHQLVFFERYGSSYSVYGIKDNQFILSKDCVERLCNLIN